MKNLKKRLQQGETLNGCWLNLGSALTAEIVGQSGFDWDKIHWLRRGRDFCSGRCANDGKKIKSF
jgi:2-keto-3-deoxy-L-rhamnonate aldolase RhmA